MARAELIRAIWADPGLRAATGLSFLLGAAACSLGPYVAQLAVETFRLGDRGYAGLLALTTLVSVGAALWVGIRSDQTGRRRGLALWAAGLMVAGSGLMTVVPAPASFVLAHGLILPASSLFGQIFALGRIAAQAQPEPIRQALPAVIRALFALPYVAVLPLWSLAFAKGAQILSIYPVGLALTVLMLVVT